MTRHRRDRQRNWLMATGAVVCAAGIAVLARIPYFYIHSHVRGDQLLSQARNLVGASNATTGAAAGNAGAGDGTGAASLVSMSTVSLSTQVPAKRVLGELILPTIHLTAPVIQGTTDSELNVAVGHLTASVLPGQPGTSILAAHNATWFRHINQLQVGDDVVVKLPGQTLTFQVTGHRIVHSGTPVYNTSGPSLLLEACYPLDAMYLTPYRYLVSAKLVQSQTTGVNTLPAPASPGYYARVPSKLIKEGLTLATNSLPMGTLQYSGTPSQAFTQSNQPLTASSAVVTLFLAWLHASADDSAVYLHRLLPKVDAATVSTNPAFGMALTRMHSQASFDITLHVNGDTLTSAQAVTEESIGTRGTYRVTVKVVTHGHEVTLQSIVFKRVSGT